MLKKSTSDTEDRIYRVDRKIALVKGARGNQIDRFIAECARKDRVLEIAYDESRRMLTVSYNLYVFNLDDLFQMLDKFAVPVRANLIDKIKHSAWQFSEQNQKDILAAPIHCCNKPPK